LEEWSQGAWLPTAESEAIPRRPQQDRAPLSFAQERLWFLHELEPDNPAYNIARAVHLSGPPNTAALEQSLNESVQRHEALRTTFSAVEGRPVQVIATEQTLQLPTIDLRLLPEHDRESEAQRLAEEEIRRPFDLAQGPLIRTTLLRLDQEEHILLLAMHHIVSDGWSMGIMFREISVLYKAFCAGKPSPLPDLPIQYADYALWQREWLQGEVLETQLTYWKEQLAGASQVLELPMDHPRPRDQSYRGAVQSVTLSRALTEKLKALSQQEGATLFMTLLAAFQTLLYRYTGQVDIVAGSPIANRTRAELEGLIGFFVNTLVLRTDLSGNPTVRRLLGQIREACLGAYSHQELPFEKLVEELQPVREPSYPPLFQAMLVLQNAPTQALHLTGLSASAIDVQGGTAQYDLNLVLRENRNGLHTKLVFNTDLFETGTARRMLGHFLNLLEGIVADPDQRIAELPLLADAEQHQLLVAWNDTLMDYPLDLCVHELFERQVERTPNAVAAAFEEQQITYRELNKRANQLAHYLQNLGAESEILVGLCMKRSVEWVVSLLGILKSGAAFVPMDPIYPVERLVFMLQNARASLVVTSEELLDRLSGYSGRRVCLDREDSSIARESEQNPDNAMSAAQLAYMVFTSGSTGSPKGVMIDHQGLVNLTLAQIDAYDVRPGTRFLQTFSLGFDASIAQITRPLCAGATLQLAPEQSLLPGPEMIRLLLDTGVSHLNLPPSLLQLLPTEELPEVKVVIVGGEACPAELVNRWAPGRRFLNAYGPTEATVGSTIYECVADGQPPPIGRPIANKQTYILDHHLQPVPVGVSGELYIGGIGLARGYWDRPDLTAESFIPNPFSGEPGARMYRTGDLAQYLPDGNIRFLGRIDQQVKIRGYRVELGEIEAVLGGHPSIHQAFALVRQEPETENRRLVAYAVPNQKPMPTVSELQVFLKEKLPDYMVPSAFIVLDDIPLTASGKVDRSALPAPEWSRDVLEAEYIAPRTPVEEVLATIWSQVLGVERVGVHDNFFELGGHSLLATQVISRVRDTLQVEIPLRVIFDSPTVAGMAGFITSQQAKVAAEEQLDQMMTELEQMPDEEIEQVLFEENDEIEESQR